MISIIGFSCGCQDIMFKVRGYQFFFKGCQFDYQLNYFFWEQECVNIQRILWIFNVDLKIFLFLLWVIVSYIVSLDVRYKFRCNKRKFEKLKYCVFIYVKGIV